jgi:nicotinate-nucleotide--dimethylbenzimidazole phosphoribosyltransferase
MALKTRPILGDVIRQISSEDHQVSRSARVHLASLTKPVGSLGRLESLATRLATIARLVPPPQPDRPALVVFAADHGVVAEGVTNWSSDVTAQMIANFVNGGAAINVLTRQLGIDLSVVDVGVASDISNLDGVEHSAVRRGTGNLGEEAAMTVHEAQAAFEVGARKAEELVDRGHNLLVTGEMGIGNTTSAAALICLLTGTRPSRGVGRGTGISNEIFDKKVAVVRTAIERARAAEGQAQDPWIALSEVGGLEIAALAGYIAAGAARGVPIVLDGVSTLAAAMIADRMCPNLRHHLIAGHRSTEPAASIALDDLDLDPILELDMRLGEGTGGALAVPIVQAAAALMSGMATFERAGIADLT